MNKREKKKINNTRVTLQWKHKEEMEWKREYIIVRDIDKKIEELEKQGWKESEMKVVID